MTLPIIRGQDAKFWQGAMLGPTDGTRQCDGEIEAWNVSNPIFVNGHMPQGAMARWPLGKEVVRRHCGHSCPTLWGIGRWNRCNGTVRLAVSALSVGMTIPGHYDDYGNGIGCRYRPWLWQKPPRMLKAGGHRTGLKGKGQAFIIPFTNDATKTLQHLCDYRY